MTGPPEDADIAAPAARAGDFAAQAAQPEVAERGGTPGAMLRPKGSCTRTELIANPVDAHDRWSIWEIESYLLCGCFPENEGNTKT